MKRHYTHRLPAVQNKLQQAARLKKGRKKPSMRSKIIAGTLASTLFVSGGVIAISQLFSDHATPTNTDQTVSITHDSAKAPQIAAIQKTPLRLSVTPPQAIQTTPVAPQKTPAQIAAEARAVQTAHIGTAFEKVEKARRTLQAQQATNARQTGIVASCNISAADTTPTTKACRAYLPNISVGQSVRLNIRQTNGKTLSFKAAFQRVASGAARINTKQYIAGIFKARPWAPK